MEELKCVDCGVKPPETESAYTLIGGKAGWRLTRHRNAAGLVIAEWRCPDCWREFKKASPAAAAGPTTGVRPGIPAPKHDSISPGGRRRSE